MIGLIITYRYSVNLKLFNVFVMSSIILIYCMYEKKVIDKILSTVI